MDSASLPPLARRFSLLKAAYVLALVVADIVTIRLAFVLAYHLRQVGDPRAAQHMGALGDYDDLALLFTAIMLAVFAARRMYIPRRGVTRVDWLYQVATAVGVGWVLALAATLLVWRALEPPRLMLIYWGLLSILLVWLGRVLLDSVLRRARRRGRDVERVLIVGNGPAAQLIYNKIEVAPELGYQVVGFIGESPSDTTGAQPVLGTLATIQRVVRRYRVGEVIIAWPGLHHLDLVEIVTGCTREQVNIKIFPDIFELMAREVETSELTGLPMMRVRDVALRGWARVVKRGLDIVASWTALVVLSPLMLFMALLIKLTSPRGPVFYVQERVGLDGKPFQILKFRSMRPDAESETGPVWAEPGDARRTPMGAFMRRFSLDEVPQFINVLLGEMSLVGPRPERPEFVEQFSRLVPRYQDRHTEKAGLTGWAQVNGQRGQSDIEERTKYDVFYVENWSLAFDLKILLKTVGTVLRDRNAY